MNAIDGLLGPEQDVPRRLPATDSARLDLLQRIDLAAEVLAQRIAENAAKPSGKRKSSDKIVVSLSDPIAPLGRDKLKVCRPLYTL